MRLTPVLPLPFAVISAIPLPAVAAGWEQLQPYMLTLISVLSIVALVLAHLSIVRMRRYQSKLEQSEERLRLSLWGSGDELWDWDMKAGQLYRSSSWHQPIEKPGDSQQFPPNRSEIHPQDVERVTSALQQHMHGMTPIFEASYRIKAANGQWIWVLDRGKVVQLNEQGQAIRMTGTFKKYSAIKRDRRTFKLICPLPGQYLRRGNGL